MQKAYSLQLNELNQARELDEERKTILAQIGALTLDMETARAQLPIVDQKRRQHLQNIVQQHGITEYRSARIEGSNLVCELPDGQQQPAEMPPPHRTNGLEVLAKE